MADVRVTGTPMEIELIARSLGTDAKMRRRRDGGTFGYLEVRVPKVICLDCETTGLDPYQDEILSLSIIDWDGNVLHDAKYKPKYVKEWTEASRINGIYPHHVRNRPHFLDDLEEVREIVWGADEIIAYNASFDLSFLNCNDCGPTVAHKITDTMLQYAREIGEWDRAHDGWKWHKLTDAAAHIGYEWTGKAHGSLADARACLAVQKWVELQRRKDD